MRIRLKSLYLWGFMLLIAPIVTGCHRAASAPAIEYDEADADLLREELMKMDWD